MAKEKVELPDRDDLIGQTIKWKCGSCHDEENPQDYAVPMFAKGIVLSCKYDQFNDQFQIRVHFVQYKKWAKWNVPQYKDLLLSEIELESGFKFRS